MSQYRLFTSGCDGWDDHDYPLAGKDKAYARRTDPDTSHQAANSVINLGQTRELIIKILKENGPQTDEALIVLFKNYVLRDDLWRAYKMASESGIRTRRSELTRPKYGNRVKSYGFGKTKSGRASIMWGINGK